MKLSDTWFVNWRKKYQHSLGLVRDDNGEKTWLSASGALQIYKDYLNRTNIEKLAVRLLQPNWNG